MFPIPDPDTERQLAYQLVRLTRPIAEFEPTRPHLIRVLSISRN
jgi:hypothetical protein